MMTNLQVQMYIIIDNNKRERHLRKGHARQNRWKSKFMYKMTSMKPKFTMGHGLEFQLTLRMLGIISKYFLCGLQNLLHK